VLLEELLGPGPDAFGLALGEGEQRRQKGVRERLGRLARELVKRSMRDDRSAWGSKAERAWRWLERTRVGRWSIETTVMIGPSLPQSTSTVGSGKVVLIE
jgi:hypothetical protein